MRLSAVELRELIRLAASAPLRRRLIREYQLATRRRWDKQRIVTAIRRWAEQYGEPPVQRDWKRNKMGDDPERLERFLSGVWPSVATVEDYFGSWNAAIETAGFNPRQRGPQIIWIKAAA